MFGEAKKLELEVWVVGFRELEVIRGVLGFLVFTAPDLSNLVNSCEMKLSGSLNFWGL